MGLALLRVTFYPPLWNEFVCLWVVLLGITHHQKRHQYGGLQQQVVTGKQAGRV
jgi:hypothetical protein